MTSLSAVPLRLSKEASAPVETVTAAALARRLRQAVQGCTLHMHGPVQAWGAVAEAVAAQQVGRAEVGDLVIDACLARVAELERQGVEGDDPRIAKERRTIRFVAALFSTSPMGKGTRPNVTADRQLIVLQDSVAPHIDLVGRHPLYARIRSVEDVRVFMEHHVFAVWDFMCLLKALQRVTTCVDVPWIPTGDGETRRLINETVRDEESDVLPDGTHVSHFELYVDAMRAIGANVDPILKFVDLVREGHLLHVAMHKADVPKASQEFVLTTMDIINVGRPHAICSAFTIGREQAIPKMFLEIVRELHALPETGPESSGPRTGVAKLRYYLERHIEIDGDKHGPLALRMLANLCSDSAEKWLDATGTAVVALQARKRLWDAVAEKLGT